MIGASIDSLVMPKLTSVLVIFALTMLNACGKPVETPVDRAVQELPRLQHQGDLDVIREHGVLRLLLERQTDSYLPRFGDALFYANTLGAAAAVVEAELPQISAHMLALPPERVAAAAVDAGTATAALAAGGAAPREGRASGSARRAPQRARRRR